MKNFSDKTAVITGGASGIGFALAEECSRRKMNIVLGDIEEQALASAVHHFEDRQVNVLGLQTDVSSKKSSENLFDQAKTRFGKIHLLFNNAGVVNGGTPPPIWELPRQDWDWVMGVNLMGVLNGIQTFTPHMIEHGEEGHIVNTSSIAAFIPGAGPYGVSKTGVVMLSETLALDLKRAQSNIGASVICPGWTNTKISDSERNRPKELTSSINPEGHGLGMNSILEAGKSPERLAEQVFESIENDSFYIFPHQGWDYLLTEHTEAMLKREGPHIFNSAAHLRKRSEGKDV